MSLPLAITLPVKGCGTTVSGAAKVLCESIAGAVRMRPVADLASRPASVQVTVAVSLGSTLTSARRTLPSVARAAVALTAGIYSSLKA